MSFATAEDYLQRYDCSDDERLGVLLEDASAMLESAFFKRHGEAYRQGVNPCFDANAKAVCCSMVARCLNTPADLYGVSQYSQGAGSYSSSVTLSNPTGDMYLSKSDKARLNISGGRVRTVQAVTFADREGADAAD